MSEPRLIVQISFSTWFIFWSGIFYILYFFQATSFTKKVDYNVEFSGNFPCSLFKCTLSNCPHALKVNDKRIGFPFNLTSPLGEGGFATVFRGDFHGGEAAFKFIPIKKEGYKYEDTSVGIHEYYQQEKINKINKINNFLYFLLIERKDPSTQRILGQTGGQAICIYIC